MRRGAGALAVGLAALVTTAAAAPKPKPGRRTRPGKVVRVERNQPKVTSSARLCQLYDLDVGNCPHPVQIGDVGLVVDMEGNYGSAPITSVNQVADACGNPVTWNIEIDMSRLSRKDYSYNAVLVLGHAVADDGRALPANQDPPAGRPREHVTNVVDDDGDGKGDLLVSTYGCDEPGQGTQSTRPGLTCTDTWIEVRDEWRLARTDTVLACY